MTDARARTYIKLTAEAAGDYTVQECDYNGANARGPTIGGVKKAGADSPTVPSPAGTAYELCTDWKGNNFFFAPSAASGGNVTKITADQVFYIQEDDTVGTDFWLARRDYQWPAASTATAGYIHFASPATLLQNEVFYYAAEKWGPQSHFKDTLLGNNGAHASVFSVRLLATDFDEATITWATRPVSAAGDEVRQFQVARSISPFNQPDFTTTLDGLGGYRIEPTASRTYYGMVAEAPGDESGRPAGVIDSGYTEMRWDETNQNDRDTYLKMWSMTG